MLVSEAVQHAKDLLGEKGSYWQDTELLRYANLVNRYLFRAICRYDKHVFSAFNTFTYPGNTHRILLTGASYLNAEPYRINQVQLLAASADPSPTNVPVMLQPASDYDDLVRRYTDTSRRASPAQFSGTALVRPCDYFYATTNDAYFYVGPIPVTDLFLRLEWLAHPAALTALSDPILANQADRYHDLFPVILSWFMTSKEKRGTVSLDRVVELVRNHCEPEGAISGGTTMPYEDPY